MSERDFNTRDFNKVLMVREPRRTHRNGFKVDAFRFRRSNGITGLLTEWWMNGAGLGGHVVSANTIDSLRREMG